MNQTPYTPIACGLHETYQLAAIKKLQIDLVWQIEGGNKRKARVRIEDVYTHSQAEYLKVITQAGEALDIRLDQIKSAQWVASGEPLSG